MPFSGSCGDDDDDDSGNITLTIPPIPTGLKAQSVGIMLTWQASSQNTVRYNIYRSTQQNEGFIPVGTTNQTTFKDTKDIELGKTYFYRIVGGSPKMEGRSDVEGGRSPLVQWTGIILMAKVEPEAIDFGGRDMTKSLGASGQALGEDRF